MAWRFYVYELADDSGAVRYVGKGSGDRLKVQRRRYGLAGHEVARFRRESDAYGFERERIAECRPPLNKHPGGNGSRATPVRVRRQQFELDIERIGSRRYAARMLLRFGWAGSKVEEIRRIAHGPRC